MCPFTVKFCALSSSAFIYIYICIYTNRKHWYFKKDFIYLFLERWEGRKEERERNINVWLPVTHPPLGTWPAI